MSFSSGYKIPVFQSASSNDSSICLPPPPPSLPLQHPPISGSPIIVLKYLSDHRLTKHSVQEAKQWFSMLLSFLCILLYLRICSVKSCSTQYLSHWSWSCEAIPQQVLLCANEIFKAPQKYSNWMVLCLDPYKFHKPEINSQQCTLLSKLTAKVYHGTYCKLCVCLYPLTKSTDIYFSPVSLFAVFKRSLRHHWIV